MYIFISIWFKQKRAILQNTVFPLPNVEIAKKTFLEYKFLSIMSKAFLGAKYLYSPDISLENNVL